MGWMVTVHGLQAAGATRVRPLVGWGLGRCGSGQGARRCLGALLLRLPRHDVGMPAREGADSRMRIAPGLWGWRCVSERGLQRQAWVNERRCGRIRVGCITCGGSLGQREQR